MNNVVTTLFQGRRKRFASGAVSAANQNERSELFAAGGLGGAVSPPPQWGPGAKPREIHIKLFYDIGFVF